MSWKQEMPAAEPLEALSPSVLWPHVGLQPGGDLVEGGRGERISCFKTPDAAVKKRTEAMILQIATSV